MIWTKLGGRKFVLCGLIVLLTTWLLLCGSLTALIYRDILLGTAGAFIVGNVSQKIWAKKDAEIT